MTQQEDYGMRAFLAAMLSEDGSPSLSRVCTLVIVVMCCVWDTHIVWIQDSLPDFAGQSLLIGTLYALNQVKHVVAAVKGP